MTAVRGPRIVSLLPSATEILFAIGAGDRVVGVTHECDHPGSAATLPAVTRDLLPAGLSSVEIDAAVSTGIRDDHTIYALDEDALEAVHPDVVVAQELCDVCAVPLDTVDTALCTIASGARVVAADPHRLVDLADTVRAVGRAVDAAEGAARLATDLDARLERVAAAVAGRERPAVAVVEWPDPPWLPGHWVPDMVEAAGGHNLLGAAGQPSVRATFADLGAVRADVVVAAFCGLDLIETTAQVDAIADRPAWRAFVGEARVVAVDGSALFSRPGPRLVDGVELLAHLLHGIGGPPSAKAAAVGVDGDWRAVQGPAWPVPAPPGGGVRPPAPAGPSPG